MSLFKSDFLGNPKFHWDFIKRVSKNIYKVLLLTKYLSNIK